ncbi:MAG TPA: class I SAM-dependent methyltransferase [Acidimicrobiales bacterium]|nr:class I SAM-dependent methyltransferase [Acidimicrobiales bacterium]
MHASAATGDVGDPTHPTAPSDLLGALEGVEGWFSPDQVARLAARAAAVQRGGRIVEIGSFRGRSTIAIARSAPPGVEIVAIDPHAGNDRGPQELDGFADAAAEDHDIFLANLERAGVQDRVTWLRRFSLEALADVAGPVDLLHIDGAHRFRPARNDLRNWGGRVAPGGSMLVHDAFSSVGVTAAIGAELLLSRRWRYVGRSRSLAEYRREPVIGRAHVRNVARQLAELPWFARNLAVKALLAVRLGRVARALGHDGETWPY